MLSQFLHGEQGALVCTPRIVEDIPDTAEEFTAFELARSWGGGAAAAGRPPPGR